MPSPFPGMDPYFEGREWTTFHAQFAVEIARHLNPFLKPRYVAVAERKEIFDSGEDVFEGGIFVPDVGVQRRKHKGGRVGSAATLSAPLEMETVLSGRVPHFWVEVRDTRVKKLVTAIEFLSPTNKRGDGRRQYLKKRDKILASPVHLLEIDLVRAGRRVPMQLPLPAAPYFIFLCRAGRRPHTQVWPIAFDEPLPGVPVPLLAPDADVTLDLQAAFTSCYDHADFGLVLDYSVPPDVPLSAPWDKWALKRVRAAGAAS